MMPNMVAASITSISVNPLGDEFKSVFLYKDMSSVGQFDIDQSVVPTSTKSIGPTAKFVPKLRKS